MKLFFAVLFMGCLCSCHDRGNIVHHPKAMDEKNKHLYQAFKTQFITINIDKQKARLHHDTLSATNIWVQSIGTDLYESWEGTPWDFNGTAKQPGTDPVACGYFVTAMLCDMGLKINRVKLAICTSGEMMKALVPGQKLRNLSGLTYEAFNDAVTKWGKGVYIIGLDFHTGFIVNDGGNNWFVHSNYINRKGVTKEKILDSQALRASKTRWMITLTGDKDFIKRWLKR